MAFEYKVTYTRTFYLISLFSYVSDVSWVGGREGWATKVWKSSCLSCTWVWRASNVLCGNKAVTFHMLIWQFSPLKVNLCFFFQIYFCFFLFVYVVFDIQCVQEHYQQNFGACSLLKYKHDIWYPGVSICVISMTCSDTYDVPAFSLGW